MHTRISQVIFTQSPKTTRESVLGVECLYTAKELDLNSCGRTCSKTFLVNIPHFTEALEYNSCLNRKVAIDSQGHIKNCPSQSRSFGNVNQVNLRDAIIDEEFVSLWRIKKDDITVCRDCEHRYICTDCRIFTQNDNDQFSKPSKCTYDPYSAIWH